MKRRWGHGWLGLSVVMALLSALSATAASGATSSWEFETPTYDFGPVALGSHPVHQFILTNTGELPIEGSGNWRMRWGSTFQEAGGLFQVPSDNCSKILEPGESCSVGLSFNPTYPGYREGELEVFPRSAGVNTATATMEGEGVGALAVVEPNHLVFGAIQAKGGASPPQTVTVKNNGNLGLTIGGMSFTDLAGTPQAQSPFRVVGGSCQIGGVVAIWGGSCTIEVTLVPSQAGSFQSRLVLSDNAFGPPQSIEVQGTGTPAPPSPSSVRVTHHPAAVAKRHGAAFWFITSPTEASAECELDHLGFKPCSSPQRYSKLARGRHSFHVRLPDASSSSSFASTSFHWRIQTPRRRPRSA